MTTTKYKIDNYEITESTNDYRIIEGLTYWEDPNHFGSVYLTQEMYDKYDLDRCPTCETILEAYGDDGEFQKDANIGDEFTHVISIDHCAGVTPLGVEYSSGEWIDKKFCNFELHATQETPHGDCYDDDFVAWWCEFPVEILSEPDTNVYIGGWSDG